MPVPITVSEHSLENGVTHTLIATIGVRRLISTGGQKFTREARTYFLPKNSKKIPFFFSKKSKNIIFLAGQESD
jgi:hypothetical protein